MNRCVRCWDKVRPHRLRCDECRKLIDDDFKNKRFRPFDWYFSFYKRTRWQEKKEI